MTTPMPVYAGAIPEAEAGGLLTIDLAALAANWRILRDRAVGAECAAVVKANAYGIGIEQAVPALAAAGCRTFFVAHLSEAIRVRKVARDAVIYVLNGLLPGTAGTYVEHNLRPVLGSEPEIAEWAALNRLPAALHIDSGMARLGLSLPETRQLAQAGTLPGTLNLSLLMSHFITSEEPDHPTNGKQIADFMAIRQLFPNIPASLANSSGLFLPHAPLFNLVRSGYALYGGNPCPGRPNPMQPVVRLEGRIVQIHTVPQGSGVGYNSRWVAPGTSRLATISVGYADGYPRSASGTDAKKQAGMATGAALIGDVLCPFVGTISMDLTIVDVSTIDPARITPGSLVTLIGDSLTIDKVGENAGTIGYEILTNLGQRYARRYVGAAS